MKKRKIKKRKIRFGMNWALPAVFLVMALIIIFSYLPKEDDKALEESTKAAEESAGSGFLEVETFPGNAEIFIDGDYEGESPDTLYNVPAGFHKAILRKEGYEDFESEVSIEPGKKTFLEAHLELIKPVEEREESREGIEEISGITENFEEEKDGPSEAVPSNKTISVGRVFLLYYDFSEEGFTNNRQAEDDIFSKRFNEYFVFTRINPANIKAIDKNIEDAKKEDCAGTKGQFEYLYSGQSLCVTTKENNLVALGGSWKSTENAKLSWKLLS
ncbi:PEGA domain-containing protein [Candidatus Woesearchaeota archaeon]|nr:PEGA domain-containing protein [Candidatus Woesearchaeota archaeon]